MSTWVIISWVLVIALTAINIFLFLKLKSASEQMLKMAFPGAKDMNEALAQMQGMMKGMGGARAGGRAPGPFGAMSRGKGSGGRANPNMDAQLKAAMDMLQKMQQSGKKR